MVKGLLLMVIIIKDTPRLMNSRRIRILKAMSSGTFTKQFINVIAVT